MSAVRTELFRLEGAVRRDPAVEAWLGRHTGELGEIAREWFQAMRDCGDDVRELLHDDMPTVVLGDAAFAYVNVFAAHVNIGFFQGSALPDPSGILQGKGKFMRHVKLAPGKPTSCAAVHRLIESAYADIKARVENAD
jgi:hypothetical protein